MGSLLKAPSKDHDGNARPSGLGADILGVIMTKSLSGPDVEAAMWMLGLGTIAFAIGLALMLNGLLFTRPRKGLEDHSPDARSQNLLDAGYASPQLRSGSDAPPSFRSQTTSNLSRTPGSVTEHTTLNLKNER